MSGEKQKPSEIGPFVIHQLAAASPPSSPRGRDGEWKMSEQGRKLAYSIAELTEISGVGRSFLYEEIKAGRLVVKKAGRRSLVLYEDAKAWLTSLPKSEATSRQRA
jgi:hypothetical protein